MTQDCAYSRFLLDIFVTACEGGLNYWFDIDAYRWSVGGLGEESDPVNFRATGVDRETGEWYEINRQVVSRGLDRILGCDASFAGHEIEAGSPIHALVSDAATYDEQLDEYDVNTLVDADVADCIIQAGLFGDVRYG